MVLCSPARVKLKKLVVIKRILMKSASEQRLEATRGTKEEGAHIQEGLGVKEEKGCNVM